MRSWHLGSGKPFFFLYLLKTHSTISRYSCVPLCGKTPSKSSQRRHRSAVFNGLFVNCLRLSSQSILFKSFRSKCGAVLKNLAIKARASSRVNPSISSKVSQYWRTFIPTSCRAVATMWHFGSILPWMISLNAGNRLTGNSSSPSRTTKTSCWLWRTNLKNSSFSCLVKLRGRSWSSIASQKTDLQSSSSFSLRVRCKRCSSMASETSDLISRHLRDNTTLNFGKELPVDVSSPCSISLVAQS